MTDEHYNELLKAYTKEAFANIIKADIRRRFPESLASVYCKQFDDAKNLADFLEMMAKTNEIKNFILKNVSYMP